MQHIENEDFISFLKGELASKGIANTSLREIFSNYLCLFFEGKKYVNEVTTTDRQTLLVENINDSLTLTLKYIIENNEYLEIEAEIYDKYLKISYSESPDLHLLYDSETPIVISALQLIKNENDYGMSLADVFSILFKSLFTQNSEVTVKNAFNLTNMYDHCSEVIDDNDQQEVNTYDLSTRTDLANIWVF